MSRTERRVRLAALAVLSGFGVIVAAASRWLAPAWAVGVFVAVTVAFAVAVAKASAVTLSRLFGRDDRLVRSLAHEIRQPLQELFLVGDLGLAGGMEVDASLGQVVDIATSLDGLLDDLFEVAQVVSGSKPLETTLIEVAPQVDRSVRRLDAKSMVSITVEGGPGELVANPKLVRLVITNLLRNAGVHAYHGQGGDVLVTIEEAGFRVRDWGGGIDEDHLAAIEHALSQGLRRSKAGVGLSLTSWVIDIHGGDLDIFNHPDGGVEVAVSFPVAASA